MEAVYNVRLDRLQEYAAFDVARVCASLGLPGITPASISGVTPYYPRGGRNKHLYDSGIIKFFMVMNPLKHDPILVSNGLANERPAEEPVLHDGRHRFLASVFRGDVTIRVSFGLNELPRRLRLQQPRIDYLTGRSDTRPG